MHIVNGTMNKIQYLHVLQSRMKPQLDEWYPENDGIFMHDKAPCHMAKSVTRFLEENNITVLDWPGNAPDINPIENLWGIIKQKLQGVEVSSRSELINSIIRFWHRDATLLETVHNLVDSMPKRMADIIRQKGGFINY